MTTTPTPADGRRSAPAVDLLDVRWRRIQVMLRFRRSAALPDPAAMRLRHQRNGASIAATGWDIQDDQLTVRFNVMQGPDRMPISPGRWVLTAGGTGTGGATRTLDVRPVPVLPGEAATLPGATFELPDRALVYRASLAGVPAVFGLDARIEKGAGRGHDRRPPAWRRAISWLGVQVFRLLYRLARRIVRRNGRRILFTSDSRPELGGNLKLVHDRMVERGLDHEFELLTLFKHGIGTRRSALDRLRLLHRLASADTIVIDDFQPVIQQIGTGDVRIVQLWHAVGAFKTVGYSRVGKPGAPNPFGPAHKNYSLVTVSSHADVPVYAEAFGIPESHVVATGIPRVDPMFDPVHREQALTHARTLFPAIEGHRVYLFAPTFRGHGARTASYDLGRIDWAGLHAVCVEKDAVCIVRMHPFVRQPLGIPEPLRDRLVDGSTTAIEPNDLLFAVDLLITDYSSIVYEYATLGRPMLFYAYDLEDYVSSRDFYEPYESFVPGRIVRTFDELVDAIRREDFEVDKVARFARRHFDHLDGGSTDRVVDLIVAR
jgi:CDP-glycerol glycerophosphotransferase (TagB/SpsB family)